jgi:hypothetical protein
MNSGVITAVANRRASWPVAAFLAVAGVATIAFVATAVGAGALGGYYMRVRT